MAGPQPTGRNQGRYCGARIDIDALQQSVLAEADRFGWSKEIYYTDAERELYVLRRSSKVARANIYLSAGIHGDEPAGPAAICDLLAKNQWPEDVGIWLFPCLNPTGFRGNSRENTEGIDLNRDYLHRRAKETVAHINLLDRLPQFDLMLCLHEDWEARGFYLYELNPDQRISPAEEIIEKVFHHCPVDHSQMIDGRRASSGIIRPNPDPALREDWPEALYLILQKTRWSYTLEAPSDFELGVRVKALSTAVEGLLSAV